MILEEHGRKKNVHLIILMGFTKPFGSGLKKWQAFSVDLQNFGILW